MSVPKSMQRIVIVPRGSGTSSIMKNKNGDISGMLEVRVYAIDFFKLSNMMRPSSTPVTMDAKLSSRSTMSAASLLTSLPAMPIATPMSAFFSAGLYVYLAIVLTGYVYLRIRFDRVLLYFGILHPM